MEEGRLRSSSRVTISDVARAAGVSRSTVSNALSGRRPTAEETKRQVLKVVQELGFRPNEVARSLRTQRTDTVALIIPDIANPFYPAMARGLQDRLALHGKSLFICNTDAIREAELGFLDSMTARGVDGMVVFSFHLDEADFRSLSESGISVVRLGDHPGSAADTVTSSQRRGMEEATRFLIGRDYRRIAYMDAPHGLTGLGERLGGYQDALRADGRSVDSELLVKTDFTRSGGREGMQALLRLEKWPDAVVCANDLMAIGALDVLREEGISVPGQVALIGFDDIEAAALVAPALTTVSNRAYDIGHEAGALLVSRMSGAPSDPQRHVVLPTQLVVRESA